MKIIYTALFIDKNSIPTSKLDKTIEFPHMTHLFKPTEVNENLFGQKAILEVYGYGINAENEGWLVRIKEASEEIKKAFEVVEVPHITLGISKDGKAVNTRYLNFEAIEPFEIEAVYDGFGKGKIIY